MWKSEGAVEPPAEFFAVAKRVYAKDPLWPMEDPQAIRWEFSKNNPYAEKIAIATWGESDAARMAGFYNPHLTIDGMRIAFFGFFESMNQPKVCQRLFAEFERWAKSHGAQMVYGPVNFTTYGMNRIRIGAASHLSPFPGEPYNPDYYATLFESCGYTVCQEYVSQFGNQYNFPAFGSMYEKVQRKLADANLRSVPFNSDFWMTRREQIYPVFQAIWKDNFGYIPIDFATFCAFFGAEATKRIDPHASNAILDTSDNVLGYFAMYPDYGPLLSQGSAYRVRANELSYQEHFPMLSNPRLLLKTGCVHPDYRQAGLFTAMSIIGHKHAEGFGYSSSVACMIRSDNPSRKMGYMCKRLHPKVVVTEQVYALYAKHL
ncbi:MAG: hypothetical protein VX278_07585 [Myxococcota bacterium]|nr:hypothetical protein [Myxococcota bacterium]